MLEHYVGGLHRSPLNPDAAREVREAFQPLCETLAAQSLGFTHRDYHSRNLMASDHGLMILDFQDARMGPCQYDLASLLKDSYVRLDSDLRNQLIELFVSRMEEDSSGCRGEPVGDTSTSTILPAIWSGRLRKGSSPSGESYGWTKPQVGCTSPPAATTSGPTTRTFTG